MDTLQQPGMQTMTSYEQGRCVLIPNPLIEDCKPDLGQRSVIYDPRYIINIYFFSIYIYRV